MATEVERNVAGQTYVLKDWPEGYHMFDHNKGREQNPRHDAYLIGSYLLPSSHTYPKPIYSPYSQRLQTRAQIPFRKRICSPCNLAPHRRNAQSFRMQMQILH